MQGKTILGDVEQDIPYLFHLFFDVLLGVVSDIFCPPEHTHAMKYLRIIFADRSNYGTLLFKEH